jgi:formylglycine-generating enzyme
MPRLGSTLVLSLAIASSASAISMEWRSVEDPGNTCDPQAQGCFGAVAYAYAIGTYEVTNSQYTEFLNAKAASDPLELYNAAMDPTAFEDSDEGGILRSGVSGGYTYSAVAGRENMPVNFVSFYDALRFTNWLNNGQGSGDTETGAYTLLGGTVTPSNGAIVTRNPGAQIFLPSEDEWYKAAYYDASSASYFDYPALANAPMVCTAPTALSNSANCDAGTVFDDSTDPDVDNLTVVGSFTGSPGPYGTFDQGGNLIEWNEAIVRDGERGARGGGFSDDAAGAAAANWGGVNPFVNSFTVGFRVAMIPEPSTHLLVIAGLLGVASWRRLRA